MNSMMDEWNKNRSLQSDPADLDQGQRNRAGKRERDAKNKKALDEKLETGLEESFPGSDPVAVTQPPHSPYDKRKS
jgi:hypothetical protein